jgi:hypothetical protein
MFSSVVHNRVHFLWHQAGGVVVEWVAWTLLQHGHTAQRWQFSQPLLQCSGYVIMDLLHCSGADWQRSAILDGITTYK